MKQTHFVIFHRSFFPDKRTDRFEPVKVYKSYYFSPTYAPEENEATMYNPKCIESLLTAGILKRQRDEILGKDYLSLDYIESVIESMQKRRDEYLRKSVHDSEFSIIQDKIDLILLNQTSAEPKKFEPKENKNIDYEQNRSRRARGNR